MRLVGRVFVSLTGTLFLLGVFGVFLPSIAEAQDDTLDATTAGYNNILLDGIIFANMQDDCENAVVGDCVTKTQCQEAGQCSLDQILQVFVNITILILGISGSAILLMFVYGGFLWITSRGDAKRVEKGKDTITHAVIGFAIIVLSYSMINFLIAALAGDAPGESLEETIENAADENADLNTSGGG